MNSLEKLIIEQSLKIKELNGEINTLRDLLKKYEIILARYEPPGLLMNALGRNLLFDLVEKT